MCNAALFLTFQKGVPREPHLVERGSRPGLNAALAWSAGALITMFTDGALTSFIHARFAIANSYIYNFGLSCVLGLLYSTAAYLVRCAGQKWVIRPQWVIN